MSYYAVADDDAKTGGDVATVAGWADFRQYIENTKLSVDELRHLCLYGWSDDKAALIDNLRAVIISIPSPPRLDIAVGLSNIAKRAAAGSVITITDGVGVKDSDEAAFSIEFEWEESKHPRDKAGKFDEVEGQEAKGVKVKLKYDDSLISGDEKTLREDLIKALGPNTTPDSIAELVGAIDGAEVEIRVNPKGRIAKVITKHPDYESHRLIYAKDYGVIENFSFKVRKEAQNKGLGTTIFKKQVDAAAKQGYKRIETTAAKAKDMNGYYTWPRLGYDASIKDIGYGRRQSVQAAEYGAYVSDFMKTQDGRDWWKKNGVTIDMSFDLADGSKSRRVLDAYAKAKGIK